MTLAFLTIGCADVRVEEIAASPTNRAELQAAGPASFGLQFDPDEVTLTGSGCPLKDGKPTWEIALKGQPADGDTGSFSILFDDFDLALDPTRAVLMKNCSIAIPIRSGTNRQFAITRFVHNGYVFLDDDVRFMHVASYSFAGTAGDALGTTPLLDFEELKGPRAEYFAFDSEEKVTDAAIEHQVWSACGREVYVILNSMMAVYNSKPRRSGVVSMSRIDGIAQKFTVEVTERQCE